MIKTTYEKLQELDTFTLKVLSQGQGLNPEVKDLIEHIESILQQQKSELKSEIYQDLIRDYHKAKTDKDDELRRKIGAILNNTYLKKITFN